MPIFFVQFLLILLFFKQLSGQDVNLLIKLLYLRSEERLQFRVLQLLAFGKKLAADMESSKPTPVATSAWPNEVLVQEIESLLALPFILLRSLTPVVPRSSLQYFLRVHTQPISPEPYMPPSNISLALKSLMASSAPRTTCPWRWCTSRTCQPWIRR